MKIGTGPGNKETYTVLQGTKRVAYTLDQVLTRPAFFRLVSEDTTGNINVQLWGESEAAIMSVQQAHRDNILVKKIATASTTVTTADFTLYE
jgi:hypothetical protein